MRLQTLLYEARLAKNCARWWKVLSTQRIHFRRADRWLKKSLAGYVLLDGDRRYANYARRDEVVYSIGRLTAGRARQALYQGDVQKAERLLKTMAAIFSRFQLELPLSGFIPSALVISGHAFFVSGRYKIAEDKFGRLLTNQRSPLAPWGRYMRGWCRLRLKAFRKAVTDFEVLVRTGKGGKILQKAGIRDLVFAYTLAHKPGRAYRRFRRVVRGNTALLTAMIVALAARYAALGNKTAAIQLYRIALKRWHRDPRSSIWRSALKALQKP